VGAVVPARAGSNPAVGAGFPLVAGSTLAVGAVDTPAVSSPAVGRTAAGSNPRLLLGERPTVVARTPEQTRSRSCSYYHRSSPELLVLPEPPLPDVLGEQRGLGLVAQHVRHDALLVLAR